MLTQLGHKTIYEMNSKIQNCNVYKQIAESSRRNNKIQPKTTSTKLRIRTRGPINHAKSMVKASR